MYYNYKNPLQKIVSGYWDFIDIKYYKSLAFFIKSVTIASDVGFLLEGIETKYGSIFEDKFYLHSFNKYGAETELDMPLFQIDVKATNRKVYCKRVYEKVQNVLANLGGIIKILMLGGLVIVDILNKTVMKFDMCNDFYDYTQIFQSDSKKVEIVRNLWKSGIKYSLLNSNRKKNKKTLVKI